MRIFLRILLAVCFGTFARAEVVRVEISERSPFAEGKSFGPAGAYERIKGRLFLETDPQNAANARICDLQRAPRNAKGQVESWTDFFLLKPVESKKGNGQLLYDVNNRGNMLALWTFNDGTRTNDPKSDADAGHGFLMRHGFSVLWCGWNGEVQADETQRLLCGLPIATENGRTITGRAHLEITSTEKVFSRAFSWSPWGIGAAYPSVSLDNTDATLTMRPHRGAEGVELPREAWAFGRWENERLVPDATHLYVKDGLRPGWLYDLVYTAKEPRVTGLGLTALRDCVSFFRYGGAKENPLAGAIQRACVFGISQSGRVIHHFLYEGLNDDESGRIVFDAARTTDGMTFTLVATPKLAVRPMQITDIFAVPKAGLMALWFAGDYGDKPTNAWGTVTSTDNGATWTQTTIESELPKAEWPTEPAAVYLGDGKILAIARTETGPTQFQIVSTDSGATWKRTPTNIGDIRASTPSLVLDPKTGLLSNYYYQRGQGLLRRRVAYPKFVFDHPSRWPASEVVAKGSQVTFDAGNVNATFIGDTHYLSFYSGKAPDTAVLVSVIPAPAAGNSPFSPAPQ